MSTDSNLRILSSLNTPQSTLKEDWMQWHRTLAISFLRESPSLPLRSCVQISEYYPLVKALSHCAFAAVWNASPEKFQAEIAKSLESVLGCPHIPTDILQVRNFISPKFSHLKKDVARHVGVYGTR